MGNRLPRWVMLDQVPSTHSHKDPKTEFYDLVNAEFLYGTFLPDEYEIRKKAKLYKLDEKSVLVPIEIVFKHPKNILTDIARYISLFHFFTRFGTNTERYQNFTTAGILNLVEKFNIANKATVDIQQC